MRSILIIVVVFWVENSFQEVHFYQDETASSVQFRFVNAALHPYHEETRNLFVFARNPQFFGRFLSVVPLILINNWDILAEAMSKKTGTLVVILDGDVADQNFYDIRRLHGIRTNYPVLVTCVNDTVCSSDVYVKNFSQSTNSPLLHYAIVDKIGSVQLFERTTTAEGNCGVPLLVRHTYKDWEAWPNRVTFYKNFNFNKCPIRLTTFLIPTISRPCEPGDPNHFCGVEGEIVKVFIEKINAIPVTTVVKRYIEIKNSVAAGRADLSYGRLRIDFNKSITYSIQYMYVKASIIVPHIALGSRTSVLTMTLPLNPEVWMGFAVVIASMVILSLIISYFRKLSALQQFGLIIGISVPTQPRPIPQRIYFFSIVLFGFLISQAYLVNLTKIYSASDPHHIKTLEELEELGLPVYGSMSGKNMLNEFGYSRLAESYKVVSVDVHAAKMIEAVTGQSRDPVHVEINTEAISLWKNYEFMEQMVRFYSVGLSVPNSSSLIRPLNQVILFMLESGILGRSSTTKSTDNVRYSYTRLPTADAINSTETRGPKKLTLNDLQGPFLLLIGALTLSIFLFIIELAVGFFFKEKFAPKMRPSSGPSKNTHEIPVSALST